MIGVRVDYATPSAFESDRDRALLGLTANARRPVRFRARVRDHVLSLRLALQTLGELIWSDDTWLNTDDYISTVLDPVITVHPDRVFFEAFSQDQSIYGLVIADSDLFETEGPIDYGTTNVDFTAWLWAALAEMRSSRETWLRIESRGLEVTTKSAGGRFEGKVDLPEAWVRGFLQLQEAMAFPGTRVTARPVDLLAAIRFMRYTKAKVSPRALRYVFEPGHDARLVLEPWEKEVPLKGATHHYSETRTIRTWGRRRLRLIEPLLPFAESVDIYLKGRALPSFYAVRLPGVTFVLGLSGWTENRWTGSGGLDLLSSGSVDETLIERIADVLIEARFLSAKDAAERAGVAIDEATRALIRLCRRGRAIFDIESRTYRHRELFETPIDETKFYPPDPRADAALALIAEKRVTIEVCAPRETRKTRKLPSPDGPVEREIVFREWQVGGTVGGMATHLVINDSARIIFGTCTCAWFAEHLLNRGPCEHMLALFNESEPQRRDLPTSFESRKNEEDEESHDDDFSE